MNKFRTLLENLCNRVKFCQIRFLFNLEKKNTRSHIFLKLRPSKKRHIDEKKNITKHAHADSQERKQLHLL